MGLIKRFLKWTLGKTLQIVWTTYTASLLLLGRLKFGSKFFAKVEHKKPKCLEGWREGFLQLSSLKLHYVQTGKDEAPLLLMLHGYPEFWYSWRFQLRHFEKSYRCVAIDMRGYNLSDKPRGVANYNVDILADDVRQVIEKLGYKSCYLLSHDWGSIVAWRTAMLFPEYIEKLIICQVPHPGAFKSSGLSQLWKSWYMFMFQSPYIPELATSSGDYFMFNNMFWGKKAGLRNKQNFTKEDLEAWKYVFSQPETLTCAINYYRALPYAKPVIGEKAIIKPDTLIIFGTGDAFVEVKGAENSLKFCRDARLHRIEGASHWIQCDEPEEVNRVIEAFLKEDEPDPLPTIYEQPSSSAGEEMSSKL